MHVQILIDAASVRRWHVELLESLRQRRGTTVSARVRNALKSPRHGGIERLCALERALHGPGSGHSRRTTPAAVEPYRRTNSMPDLVIDLCGQGDVESPTAWRLEFDGVIGEDAAIKALVDGRFPLVTVNDVRTGREVVGGRPGSECPGIVAAAFDDVLAGCMTLVHAALDGSSPRSMPTARSLRSENSSLVRHGVATVASPLVRGTYRSLFRTPHWRVGWRFVDGEDVIDLGGHPATGWNDLADDGHHFYADPFPIVVDGQTYLFVEDFDHRVGRGVISALRFDDDGPVGRPFPVLAHDVHLSYPFVFEADGEIWMIPETSAARRVELYRADAFPSSWVREKVLLDAVDANDVTVCRYADRWWMFATVRNGGSHSDTLHIWSADHILGRWEPHPANPVVVDISSARPAGRVVARDDRLIRPVQDCTNGYGAELGLMEVLRLDRSAFVQRKLAHITPGPLWPGRRVHTLNRAGRLECIDGSRLSPRFRLPQRTDGGSR